MRRRAFVGLLGVATFVCPVWVSAQQKTMPVIGYLGNASPGSAAVFVAELRQGLSEAGYIEGQNLAMEYRWAEGRYDRLPALAADLVGRKVDAIVAIGPAILAAKRATSTIPIVFVSADPVAENLVVSLARPGGNLTGLSLLLDELTPKRIELLSELAPQARVIALLVNPNNPSSEHVIRNLQDAANAKGLQLDLLKAGTENEIDAAFAQLQAGGLIIGADPFLTSRGDQLVALAAHCAVPVIYSRREFVEAGGLISYGTRQTVVFRRAGIYVGRILKGAKPADLPVEQPTTFELIVNLKTAKALGLTIPQSILARADEVIE